MIRTKLLVGVAILLAAFSVQAQISDVEGDADIPCIDITSLDVRGDSTTLTVTMQTSMRPYPPEYVIEGVDDPNAIRLCPNGLYQVLIDTNNDGEAEHTLATQIDGNQHPQTTGPESLVAEVVIEQGWIEWTLSIDDLNLAEYPGAVQVQAKAELAAEWITVVPLVPHESRDTAFEKMQTLMLGVPGSALIGKSGGILSVVDEDSPISGFRLDVPEGVFQQSTNVWVEALPERASGRSIPASAVTRAVAVHPSHGLEEAGFGIRIPLNDTEDPADSPILLVREHGEQDWGVLPEAEVADGYLTARVPHLSEFVGDVVNSGILDSSIHTGFLWINDFAPISNYSDETNPEEDGGYCQALSRWAYWYNAVNPSVKGISVKSGLRFAYQDSLESKEIVREIDWWVHEWTLGVRCWFCWWEHVGNEGREAALALANILRTTGRPAAVHLGSQTQAHTVLVYEWIARRDDSDPYFNVFDPNWINSPTRWYLRSDGTLEFDDQGRLPYTHSAHTPWSSLLNEYMQAIFDEHLENWTHMEMPRILDASAVNGVVSLEVANPRVSNHTSFPVGHEYYSTLMGPNASVARENLYEEEPSTAPAAGEEEHIHLSWDTKVSAGESGWLWVAVQGQLKAGINRLGAPVSEALMVENKFQPELSMIAHWKLDGDAVDSSGNDHHGVVRGATPAPDRRATPDGAMRFDGIDDYIELGSLGLKKTLTVNAWAYDQNPDEWYYNILFRGRFNWASPAEYDINMGKGWCSPWTRTGQYGPGTSLDHFTGDCDDIIENEWHMYTYVLEDRVGMTSVSKLYVDGDLLDQQEEGSSVSSRYDEWYLAAGGRRNNPHPSNKVFWKGIMDDVRVYDSVLTDEEIQQLYRDTAPSRF